MTDIASLQRFARPGTIAIDAGLGGLPRVSFSTPLCRGEFYLHGAHLTAWQPAGHAPVLWLGSQSWFAAGKPIRGGIPVCWPWFGPAADPAQPAHGVARLQPWSLESLAVSGEGEVTAVLRLAATAATRAIWDAAFDLRLTAVFGRRLAVELAASNTGATAFPVGEALHTYLAVADVRRVAVKGLAGAAGQDRVAQPFAVTGAEELRVAAETDLLFTGTDAVVTVADPGLGRTLRVSKSGSGSTVVWNPWVAKAARLADFGDHEWPGMICIEAANAGADVYQLQPGASHRLRQVVEVL